MRMATGDLMLGIGMLLIVGIGVFLVTRGNRQKQKMTDLILISKVYSVSKIASLAGVKQDRAIRHIQYLITHANSGTRAWRILRGAHLDLNNMEIVLAEVDETEEALSLEGLVNKAKKVVHSKLAEHLPEEAKEPWNCPYCRTVNDGEEHACKNCKAAR